MEFRERAVNGKAFANAHRHLPEMGTIPMTISQGGKWGTERLGSWQDSTQGVTAELGSEPRELAPEPVL